MLYIEVFIFPFVLFFWPFSKDMSEKHSKKSKEEKSKPDDSRSKQAAKSSKEELLLAAKMMEKPPTPGFSPKDSQYSGLSPSSVEGILPVMKDARVDQILATMEEQKKDFSNFMLTVTTFMQKSKTSKVSSTQVSGAAKRKAISELEADLDQVDVAESSLASDEEQEEISFEDKGSLMDEFQVGKNMFVPSDFQKELWLKAVKLTPEFGKTAWMNLKASILISKWTSHPLADAFTAPKLDPGLIGLHYEDLKASEKQMVFLQNCSGAMAAIVTRVLAVI